MRHDDTYKQVCNEFKVDENIIDLIPVRFGNIDVSARTAKGIIILNNKLLKDFDNNIHYLLHEIVHYIQMVSRDHPTKGSNDGNYLDNEDEIEAFTYQIEYMDDLYGDDEANDYIEHLLNHHEIKNKKERKEKKKELSERCDD